MAAPSTFLDRRDAQLLEQGEAEYFRRFLGGAPESVRVERGISTEQFEGGMAAAMRVDPSGYWTKAMGFGFESPVDEPLVAEIVRFFVAAGKEAGIIALAPATLPEDWEAICERHGLASAWSIAKFACPIEDFVAGSTDLEVRQLSVDDVPGWARIIREAMGMPEPDLTPMLIATIEDPLAKVFGAWDGDLLVGTGAVHLLGEVASLNTGGTLASHRGRGVQSAIIAARAEAAAAHGCRLLTAETGAESPDNASYRNLVRAGFTHHYDRMNWRWIRSENLG